MVMVKKRRARSQMVGLEGGTLLEQELRALLRAGLFPSEEQALREAISVLFTVKPVLRLEAAIEMFKSDEVSLGRAAEIAGLTRWQFQNLLAQRGIVQEMEVESLEDLQQQVRTVQRLRRDARRNQYPVR
jgi:predicted HTH domain antitoxin